MWMNANFPVVIGSGVYNDQLICRIEAHVGAEYVGSGLIWDGDRISVETMDERGNGIELWSNEKESR